MRVNGVSQTVTALLSMILSIASAEAQNYSVLYNFGGTATDGAQPNGALLRDAKGNTFGTTSIGGKKSLGTVFKITAKNKEKVLHSFTGPPRDGELPQSGLVEDSSGDLYGTTTAGGQYGLGTVFKVTAKGTETILYSFAGAPLDGSSPTAGLVFDSAGYIYGTTSSGGSNNNDGTLFKLDATTGAEIVLHSFGQPMDGATPFASLLLNTSSKLYGTTANGGLGFGTVFEFDTGTLAYTVLYRFLGPPSDGASPASGLVIDSNGNLYGTTAQGGTLYNFGTLFRLNVENGAETILHNFAGQPKDGSSPTAGLVQDASGNLYGTTPYGGSTGNYGTAFELDVATQTYTVLHNFAGPPGDGYYPSAGLALDASKLFGVAPDGGTHGCCKGIVFELNP